MRGTDKLYHPSALHITHCSTIPPPDPSFASSTPKSTTVPTFAPSASKEKEQQTPTPIVELESEEDVEVKQLKKKKKEKEKKVVA